LIYKFAGKRVADMLSGRTKQIETDLADLDERKEDAEKRLLEVEASIANLEAEKAKILDDAKAQGEAMRQAIIDKAEVQAAQIKAQAEIPRLRKPSWPLMPSVKNWPKRLPLPLKIL
jgi:F-type H+-transporting ATPase subunit b